MNKKFAFVQTPERSIKPREQGITSLIDKGIGLNTLQDILTLGADYIDLVKFAFGTAVVIPSAVLQRKINWLHEHHCHITFGGTLFEIIETQGSFTQFIQVTKEFDLNYIEVSDGALPIPRARKIDCIKEALDHGLTVVSEVGNKQPDIDDAISIEQRIAMIQEELDAGSWKVIVEARESGTVGLFDTSGQVEQDEFNTLVQTIPVQKLIFEAPQKSQQAWFINQLGSDVNLGNIAPHDVISLESLRQKLRADTV